MMTSVKIRIKTYIGKDFAKINQALTIYYG